VLANLLGGIVAYLLGTFFAMLAGRLDPLLAALTGAIIGLAQWQVLRDYVPRLRLLGWVALTTLGFGISLPVFQGVGQLMALAAGVMPAWEQNAVTYGPVPATLGLVDEFAFPTAILAAAAAGAFAGLIAGALQSLSLRLRLHGAGLWVPASMAGGVLGILAGLWLALLAGANLVGVTIGPVPALIAGVFFSPWGLFIFSSTMTGLALVFLLRRNMLEAERYGDK
jgi:hypothetical protein